MKVEKTLEEREEEYKRVNAELEAQTAELVKEADKVMQKQNSFLYNEETEEEPADPTLDISEDIRKNLSSLDHDSSALLSIAAGGFEDYYEDFKHITGTASRPSSARVQKLPRKQVKGIRPFTSHIPKSSTNKYKSHNFGKNNANSLISKRNKSLHDMDVNDSDVMPEAAAGMATEAQLRLLKAKVHVLQEELSTITNELKKEVESRSKDKGALKAVNDELEKKKKTCASQHNQIQKLKAQLESEKKQCESKAQQLGAANKRIEASKRHEKQQKAAGDANEVRLNRALEELEKAKAALRKEKSSSREGQGKLAEEVEALRASNKKLERVKAECVTMVKKQQSLIGVLKKQIVHIEAAKLLSFTEEEFLKTLDWESV